MYPKAVSSQPHIASIRAAAMILAAAAAGGCATRTKRVTMDVVPTHNLPVAQKYQQIDLALSDQILIEAEPKAPLAVPKFPAGISLKTPVAVPMRIVVGTDGAVENVTLQPGKFSATVPYYSRFEAEIRKAVRDWTFVPARIIYTKNNRTSFVGEQKVEMYFDMDFKFDISTTHPVTMGVGEKSQVKR